MTSLISRYEALVATGELIPDPEQAEAALRLDTLRKELECTDEPGLIGKLLGRKRGRPTSYSEPCRLSNESG